ncbi:MAG: metallophosphoesterase, partial [Clostridia bacterium]|nr:metallophosphoesterase [Clostridia bacterium]
MKTVGRKKYFCIAVLFVVLCAFMAGIGLSAVKAEATVEEKTIRIAHISDMHVMIEEYCNVYSGKYLAETKVTKLLEETPMIAEAVFEDIYNMNENAPMYVFITGDVTSNGEYDNHVWLSKLYKAFTQKMRSRTDYDFSGFQIFLSPGNHDLYNCKAKSFMPTQEELDARADDAEREALLEGYEPRSVASITSKQFMDLYSDFGYCSCPDRKNGHHLASCGMIDGCCLEYFFESDYWYDNSTSRDGTGLEVRTPSDKTLEAFKASDKDYNILNPDARFGACSYIARMNDFDVITFDSNTRGYKYEKWNSEGNAAVRSCRGWHESTGGMVSEDQLRWAVTSVKDDVDANKAVFALGHTNFLPHFDSEDEVISLFTYDNWEQASYTLADNGVRYLFSGHQHASDITSYVTQNGNVAYDIETGSLASYGCSWRTMDLKRTISNGVVTEDFESLTHNLNYAPFEYGVYKLSANVTTPAIRDPYDIIPDEHPNGYMKLEKRVTVDKITGEELGIADYLAAQMYNMASSLEYGLPGEYVGENIYGLLGGLTEKLSSLSFVQGLVSGLVNGLPTIDLCEFSFQGNRYSVSEKPVAGYDLADFTQDLAEYLIQYDFSGDANKELTLAKAFLVVYGGHLSGAHSDVMDEEIAPLIDFLKSGKFVRGLVNLLEDALLPQLEILLDAPIRFDTAT